LHRKTVFHIEYAGPILMHALCYYGGALLYGKSVEHSYTQTVAFWLVVAHYLKRESGERSTQKQNKQQ